VLKVKGGPKFIKPFRKYIEWNKKEINYVLEKIGWKKPNGIRYNKFRKLGTAGSKNREDKAAAVW